MREAATVLAVLGALGCWIFVVSYWWLTRGDWRRTSAGRHLMFFTAVLGLIMSLIVAARIWPGYPGRHLVTTAAFALLVAQVWWRVFLLFRAQQRQ